MSLKSFTIRLLVVIFSTWLLGGGAYAQDSRQRFERAESKRGMQYRQLPEPSYVPRAPEYRERGGLSPEQRQYMRQQMRQYWQEMPKDYRAPPQQRRPAYNHDGYRGMRQDLQRRDWREPVPDGYGRGGRRR